MHNYSTLQHYNEPTLMEFGKIKKSLSNPVLPSKRENVSIPISGHQYLETENAYTSSSKKQDFYVAKCPSNDFLKKFND